MSFLSFIFVVLLACIQISSAAEEFLSWGESLEKCAEKAWDDYSDLANQCQKKFAEQRNKPEVIAQLKTCDALYCVSVGGLWNATSLTCDYETDGFRSCGVSCDCMENNYPKFMNCTRIELLKLYDHKPCHDSEMYKCVGDTLEDEFVSECKRGVKDGRISWMDAPVPKSCDSKKICQGSSLSPIGLLAIVLTILTVFFS